MNKRRILLIAIILSLGASVLLCGTVWAYMFTQTEYQENEFTPAAASCEVLESFDGQSKSSIKIRNTGSVDIYLRIRFVSYWVDTEGNILSKPSEMPEISLAEGWIKGANDTYYYQTPVGYTELNNSTTELLASPIALQEDGNGYLQVLEVFAEGIQSNPPKAVTSSWGVTVDANGKITSAP